MSPALLGPDREAAEGASAGGRFLRALKGAIGECVDLRLMEPLARRTTLRVGGPAEYFAEPRSEEALSLLLRMCTEHRQPVFVLGRGSNVLVKDGGIRGVVIALSAAVFGRIELNDGLIWAGAGARLKDVSHAARRLGLAGFEFFEGIPGSIGGALRMNAGAMGSTTFGNLVRLRTVDRDGLVHERERAAITASYRDCPLLREEIALGAWFKGTPDEAGAIGERMKRYNEKRWETQPPHPSAGCIFRNPESVPAGRLVEQLQLKGAREGGASVSLVHGNFIVNDQGATAGDVLALIDKVRITARKARGIELHTEVEIVGCETPFPSPEGGPR